MAEKTFSKEILFSSKSKLTAFSFLLVLILVIPTFLHNQWITGPVVNAILLIGTALVGPAEAITLGLIPSTVALSSGLLPVVLAPMVPFIMIGNAIFVIVFHNLRFKNFTLAVIVGALLKAGFLYGIVKTLMPRLVEGQFVQKLAIMFSWPQFVTALIGGLIAFTFIKIFKNHDIKNSK